MRKNKRSYPSVQFGTSLMLVVFIVLCLTAFAALSLSSALRSYEYSKKAADRTALYYQADALSRHKAAEIEQVLKTAYETYPDSYMEHALTGLEGIQGITLDTQDESAPAISWQTPINDSQALQAVLILNDKDRISEKLAEPDSENKYYLVSSWKEISVEDWNNETSLPVIGSE